MSFFLLLKTKDLQISLPAFLCMSHLTPQQISWSHYSIYASNDRLLLSSKHGQFIKPYQQFIPTSNLTLKTLEGVEGIIHARIRSKPSLQCVPHGYFLSYSKNILNITSKVFYILAPISHLALHFNISATLDTLLQNGFSIIFC